MGHCVEKKSVDGQYTGNTESSRLDRHLFPENSIGPARIEESSCSDAQANETQEQPKGAPEARSTLIFDKKAEAPSRMETLPSSGCQAQGTSTLVDAPPANPQQNDMSAYVRHMQAYARRINVS